MRYNPTFLGTFVKHLPVMLESSPALVATVACCLDACRKNALPRHLGTQRSLSAHLYGRALSEINTALDDPEQNCLDSTFYAVVLLQRIETVLVNRRIELVPCWCVQWCLAAPVLAMRYTDEMGSGPSTPGV